MTLSAEHLLGALDGATSDWLVESIKSVLIDVAQTPSALQRATALWVWKRKYDASNQMPKRGGDRRSSDYREQTKSVARTFDLVAAEATGLDDSSIRRDVALIEQLNPALRPGDIRRLWTSGIADNGAALKSFAALDPVGRDSLFSIWNDNPKLGFGAAMLAAQLRPEEDSDEASFARLVDGWTRASAKARRRFLTEIGVPAAAVEAAITRARKGGAK